MSNEKNHEIRLTNRRLCSELKLAGLCYKNTARFQDGSSSAFNGISIIH